MNASTEAQTTRAVPSTVMTEPTQRARRLRMLYLMGTMLESMNAEG